MNQNECLITLEIRPNGDTTVKIKALKIAGKDVTNEPDNEFVYMTDPFKAPETVRKIKMSVAQAMAIHHLKNLIPEG
jgi:hypothetical protein